MWKSLFVAVECVCSVRCLAGENFSVCMNQKNLLSFNNSKPAWGKQTHETFTRHRSGSIDVHGCVAVCVSEFIFHLPNLNPCRVKGIVGIQVECSILKSWCAFSKALMLTVYSYSAAVRDPQEDSVCLHVCLSFHTKSHETTCHTWCRLLMKSLYINKLNTWTSMTSWSPGNPMSDICSIEPFE